MPIPGDELGRHWVQALPQKAVDDEVRAHMVTLVSFNPAQYPVLVGSGFIVCSLGNHALVLTAKHNFDHADHIQQPWSHSHPTALKEFTAGIKKPVSVGDDKMRAIRIVDSTVDFCIIREVNLFNELDIALCVIESSDPSSMPKFDAKFAVDSATPKVNDQIVAVGFHPMGVEIPKDGPMGERRIHRGLTVRRGVITKVHEGGLRHYKWPCVETSIPVEPGMSGGPVFSFSVAGGPLAAFGIITADISTEEAKKSFLHAGTSIISLVWPAFALHLEDVLVEPEVEGRSIRLAEFVERGLVDDISKHKFQVDITTNKNGSINLKRSQITP